MDLDSPRKNSCGRLFSWIRIDYQAEQLTGQYFIFDLSDVLLTAQYDIIGHIFLNSYSPNLISTTLIVTIGQASRTLEISIWNI